MSNTIATPGSDLYYSFLFLDKAKKDAVIAWHSLCQTLTNMLTLKENDIFTVKWGWWQQEFARMLAQQATHPAAIAWQDKLIHYKIPPALMYDYLDGIQLTRQLDHCCSEEDFQAFSYRHEGIRQTIAAYIYGFRDPSVLHYTRVLGAVLTLMNEIIYFGQHVKQERVFLPLTSLSAWQDMTDEAIHEVLSTQANKALADYANALTLLPKSEYASQHPSLIEAKLKTKQLRLCQHDFSKLLQGYSELTPFRKYLTAWWYYRRCLKATPERRHCESQ